MRSAIVRKSSQLLLCAAVLFTLYGCGSGEESESPAPAAAGPSAVENSNDSTDSSKPQAEAEFQLTIDAVADDPTVVDVTVVAANPAIWSQGEDQPDKRWQSVLMLHRVEASDQQASESATRQPVVGRYEVLDGRLRFRPAFPLLAGELYRAQFIPSEVAGSDSSAPQILTAEYKIPAAVATTPMVETIYPSGNILPANHLKFYVLFSEPMQRNGIFEYFRLIDLATNKPVPRPFRHVELWSSDHKQLTLWFHPGRQKRGVNLNVEVGPVLKPDGEYRLEIDGEWRSAAGHKLGETITKNFRTGPADHRQPAPETWILSGPQAGSMDVLTCDFHEPLDWGLLHSELAVVDAAGKKVAGRIETGYGELSWAFHVKQPWQPGKYRVAVGKLLEDLAGNSVEKPFEVDVSQSKEVVKKEPVFLEFEVLEPQP